MKLFELKREHAAKQREYEAKRSAALAVVKRAEARDEEMNDSENEEYKSCREDMDNLSEEVKSLANRIAALEDIEGSGDDAPEEEKSAPVRKTTPINYESRYAAPAVHTKKHQWSLMRAVRGLKENRVDGLEKEMSDECARQNERPARGFYVPHDMSLRRSRHEQRTLNLSAGVGGIAEILDPTVVDYLYARLICSKVGATMMPGLQGYFAMARQNATATAGNVAESTAQAASNLTLDQVEFRPHSASARSIVSRRFINSLTVNQTAEQLLINDLMAQVARKVDQNALAGDGLTNNPTGILNTSGVDLTTSLGATGGAPTYEALVGLETKVATANADLGKLAYVTTPGVRGELKFTPKIGSTFPVFAWENDGFDGDVPVGVVNGYKAYATNLVPSNLTKSSGSNLHAIIYGNWADLVIAMWGGLDVTIDPFYFSDTGDTRISVFQDYDIGIKHPASFACIVDASV